MKILTLFLAFIALEILPTNVLAKMGDAFPGSSGGIIYDLFVFILLTGTIIWAVVVKIDERQQKKVLTKSPKKKPSYNGFEVKTVPSGKHEGRQYTVNSDGAFNSLLPANAVITQKTKKELELDKMTKIIAEQKKERERKKRLKDNQKKKVVKIL